MTEDTRAVSAASLVPPPGQGAQGDAAVPPGPAASATGRALPEPREPGLVLIDKPEGMTSHDVVARVRKGLGTRRVGHAGTLDPLATGVLVLGVERGTKLLGQLQLATKSYDVQLRLGWATTTDDAQGEALAPPAADAVDRLTDAALSAAVERWIGTVQQVPAAVSAIKVDGQRAYARVRNGEAVDLPARTVTITDFTVHAVAKSVDHWDVTATVACSSGTYIRSLARDIGAELGVGGHVRTLRRTALGPFTVAEAATLTEFAAAPSLQLSIDAAVTRCFEQRQISVEEAYRLSLGQWLEPEGRAGTYAAIDPAGRAIALIREKGTRAGSIFTIRPATLAGP